MICTRKDVNDQESIGADMTVFSSLIINSVDKHAPVKSKRENQTITGLVHS